MCGLMRGLMSGLMNGLMSGLMKSQFSADPELSQSPRMLPGENILPSELPDDEIQVFG